MESDWIFTYDGTNPINPDTVTHYVKAVATRVGVDTHLHVSVGTSQPRRCSVEGPTSARSPGVSGTRDASTTLRVYSHALPERDRDAAGLLGRALSG